MYYIDNHHHLSIILIHDVSKQKTKEFFLLWVVGEMQSHHIGILLRLIACVLNATGVNFQKIGQQSSSNGRWLILGGLALSAVRRRFYVYAHTYTQHHLTHNYTKTDFGYFRYFEFRIRASITFGTIRSDYIGM